MQRQHWIDQLASSPNSTWLMQVQVLEFNVTAGPSFEIAMWAILFIELHAIADSFKGIQPLLYRRVLSGVLSAMRVMTCIFIFGLWAGYSLLRTVTAPPTAWYMYQTPAALSRVLGFSALFSFNCTAAQYHCTHLQTTYYGAGAKSASVSRCSLFTLLHKHRLL